MKKTEIIRVLIAVLFICIITVGIIAWKPIGTLSAFGWKDIALICPVGALTTMLAAKTFIPKALISLALAIAAFILLGRAFCGWVCPVPIVSRLRDMFAKKPSAKKIVPASNAPASADANAEATEGTESAANLAPLTADEQALLGKGGCAAHKQAALDSRHLVLGGALLSAAIFGVPVFCLVCPIGLTFATIILVMLLFGGGDVTLSVIIVPALLLVEVVFFRKWCSKICPLSAFMSLCAKLNRTWRPKANAKTCIELGHGGKCGKCAEVCPVGIDPHRPENGASLSECTRCKACADVCPTHAITFLFTEKNE